MISYAQNHEDVILARVFKGVARGTYIDIGAMDPEFHSVTKHFYDSGWSGINVEPNPVFFEKLRAARLRDLNLNCGVGAEVGLRRFAAFHTEGLSSFNVDILKQFPQYPGAVTTVPVLTLRHIAEAAEGAPQFLKIDVEGYEMQVLMGGDFSAWRPEVIIIESIDTVDHSPRWHEWEHLLTAREYEFVYFDGLNRFYLRSESSHLRDHFSLPPNVFDGYELAEAVGLRAQLSAVQAYYSGQSAGLSEQPTSAVTSAVEQSPLPQIARSPLQDELAAAQSRVAAAELELGALRSEAARLQESNSALQQRISELQDAAADAVRHAQEMQQTKDADVEERLKHAIEALAEASARNQQLAQRVSQLEQQIQVLEAEGNQSRAAHQEDRLWIGQLTQERVQERLTRTEIMNELEVLRERCAWYEQHVRSLQA